MGSDSKASDEAVELVALTPINHNGQIHAEGERFMALQRDAEQLIDLGAADLAESVAVSDPEKADVKAKADAKAKGGSGHG